MTKSKGIKRPDFEWTSARIEFLKAQFLEKTYAQIATALGCSESQIWYKIKKLCLRKPIGSMLVGREQSVDANEKRRESMKRAHRQGRMPRPSDNALALLQAGSQRPEVIQKRAKKAAATMRGIPQRMDGLTAAAEHNIHAKTYTVISPDHSRLTFTNLRHFVRENPHLFAPEDTVWRLNGKLLWCRACIGLTSLFRDKRPAGQWKGWRAAQKQPSILHFTPQAQKAPTPPSNG